tara:strand:+ start:1457 stop:1672 length:216 start_codon:yes stop_codon:yes gene_type:complete
LNRPTFPKVRNCNPANHTDSPKVKERMIRNKTKFGDVVAAILFLINLFSFCLLFFDFTELEDGGNSLLGIP